MKVQLISSKIIVAQNVTRWIENFKVVTLSEQMHTGSKTELKNYPV